MPATRVANPWGTPSAIDALRGPAGTLPIGYAETLAEEILYMNEALGSISRITFQMGVFTPRLRKMLRGIEILELAGSNARD